MVILSVYILDFSFRFVLIQISNMYDVNTRKNILYVNSILSRHYIHNIFVKWKVRFSGFPFINHSSNISTCVFHAGRLGSAPM